MKLHQLRLLIVGAGQVGMEKLSFILKSSPEAQITVVATWINSELPKLLEAYPDHRVTIYVRPFRASDVKGHDLVIAATNDRELNQQVWQAAKDQHVLINVADTPHRCDFYLGSIVTKGPVKIGISTNGQSPTLAKRLRELLEEMLPEEIGDLAGQLKAFRDQLGGDFEEKVRRLNELTALLVSPAAAKDPITENVNVITHEIA